jgi:hypothetical protein
MVDQIRRLATKFRQQEEFATGYSPLYADLFGAIASWLEDPAAAVDPLVTWLVDAGLQRRSLDITLLLAAALHRQILSGEAADLARYYPTAGGSLDPGDDEFAAILLETILANRRQFTPFITSATVQTNETGRGLCWLLPVLATRWRSIHLVDLGASAGLNLVAEKRSYRLVEAESDRLLADLGLGQPVQFVTSLRGRPDSRLFDDLGSVPHIAGRTGSDIAPFPLSGRDDELTLAAFIWGDQIERIRRLREGIEAFRHVESTTAPVIIHQVDLPDDLSRFLNKNLPAESREPIVIYNTWMTAYLRDNGQSLLYHIDQWAVTQDRPILWLQWEPPRDGAEPPEYGFCAWTADLWNQGTHRRWLLGWVHPHGASAELGPGFNQWREIFSFSA